MGLNVESKNIFCAFLPATDEPLYVVPSGRKLFIRSFRLTNDSDVVRKINLRIQKAGTYARLVPYDFRLCGRHMASDDDLHTLDAGDQIRGSCDLINAVTCKISGIEEKVT